MDPPVREQSTIRQQCSEFSLGSHTLTGTPFASAINFAQAPESRNKPEAEGT